ncbi:scavenger receptor class F member 1-like [Haliotis cracherodii]|uniref:scavenger receptor class F member 1-like n=1 Tax=Haliotis cracherodii TaxID=6455 RepID=UPI0039E96ECD
MDRCRLILYVVLWSVVVGTQHGQCPVGFYGSSCQHTCPMTCNNQQCNIDEVGRTFCIDGCVDGYRGTSCRIPCPVNCQVCERLNGSCINCKATFHGTNCTLTCEELCQGFRCETDQRCSKTTCLDGWYGQNCSNKCYPRYLTCARSTGGCTACRDGFHGSFCFLPCPQCGFTDNRTDQTCKDGCKRTPCSNIKHGDSGNSNLAVSGVLLVLVTGIVILQCRNHHSIRQQGSTGHATKWKITFDHLTTGSPPAHVTFATSLPGGDVIRTDGTVTPNTMSRRLGAVTGLRANKPHRRLSKETRFNSQS